MVCIQFTLFYLLCKIIVKKNCLTMVLFTQCTICSVMSKNCDEPEYFIVRSHLLCINSLYEV